MQQEVVEEHAAPTEEQPVPWKRGPKQKPKQDEIIEKKPEEGGVPWTDMPLKLKPTVRQTKLIEREKLEEVELKPSKIQKSAIEKEMLEDVSLKPVPKQVTEDSQVAEVSTVEEDDEETVEKRKVVKKVVKVKKTQDKETISHEEDSALLEVDTVSVRIYISMNHPPKVHLKLAL